MLNIFLKEDMIKLLWNKSVILMGDSNVRALYKDFLYLLQNSKFIPIKLLKQKMEGTCCGDKLVFHGERTNGRDYREEREARIGGTSLSFFFLTRVYNNYVEEVLRTIERKGQPDVLIINCCVWDVTRWGPTGVEEYKKRLKTLMQELKRRFPNCLVIWVTAPPMACEMKGGFLLKELQFLRYSVRFHVMEANHYARKIVVANGFDVLDSHYHLKMQIHRREGDGIHWHPHAVRYVTNLLLTHISLAWDRPLPHRYKSEIMEQNLEAILEDDINIEILDDTKTKALKTEAVISSTAQETYKENCDTPKRKKKKKKKKTPTPNPVAVKPRNTHHAFFSKIDNDKRRKRIRQWQNPGAANSSYLLESPVSHRDVQHDSGYISSPNYSNMSPSPSFTSYRRQVFFQPDPYSPLQEPYKYSDPYSRGNRYFREPYVPPPLQQNYEMQPHIDFTSYDPSGIFYF